MKSKIIEHPTLGAIFYKKNKRSKRVTIRVKEEGKIYVTLPYQISYQQAVQLVNNHRLWVEEQVDKRTQEQLQKALNWESNFLIGEQKLSLKPYDGKDLKFQTYAEELVLFVPQKWNLEASIYQNALKDKLTEILRKFAKLHLPARTHYWADYHQIKINAVRVKKVQTRWGSCSSKGNINLSLYLMLLPKAWIDYVICHELAHIAHPNHSTAFWEHLEELLPGARQLDKALGQYKRPF